LIISDVDHVKSVPAFLVPLRAWSARFLVVIFFLVPLLVLRVGATIQLLPIDCTFSGYNGRPLSGDGSTVTGTKLGHWYYWTQSEGKVLLHMPATGLRWTNAGYMSFNGMTIAGAGRQENKFTDSAWTWIRGQGIRYFAPPDGSVWSSDRNIGVSPDGTTGIRLHVNIKSGLDTVYRDSGGGMTTTWVQAPNGQILGASEDATILFGVASLSSSKNALPCFWNLSGQLLIGTSFSNQDPSLPELCSKNGQVIVGTAYTPVYNSQYNVQVTKAFRWNTMTNQINFYLPAVMLDTMPDAISPDGNIFHFGGFDLDAMQFHSWVLDQSTPDELAKGPQDLASWLISHQYLSSSDTQNRHSFRIFAMSDDNLTIVGLFSDSNNQDHSFVARRP
jgi:hypothetical protein